MKLTLARHRFFLYVAAAVLAAVASFTRTPYSLMLPGRAVDLRHVVSVAGRATPATPFFLTDVRFASHVTPLQLLAGMLPGASIFRTREIVPGNMTAVEYEGVEREAMSESQSIAAVVAERAAGLKVPYPRSRVLVVYFSASSHASKSLRPLDMLVALNGHPIASNVDVIHALANVRAGSNVRMAINRRGNDITVNVPTIRYGSRTALGAYLTTIYQRPHIPVAVSFHLPQVSGSSGGLMFALDIYRRLRPSALHGRQPVAGTGTIAYDGSVGPIEGASQKVIAARRAGARIFLVPRDDYSQIAATHGIRVIPVSTFHQALRALGG
ncbi:MAG TPA: PDZ domain-containing protein [Candidatus Baltobacteraceae bacterium]